MAKSENRENSRMALILAAGELFARDGVSGTKVRAIAALAGVNVALINYHFGNKDGLVNAVIDFVLENYRHYMPNAFIDAHPELWQSREGQKKIGPWIKFKYPKETCIWKHNLRQWEQC